MNQRIIFKSDDGGVCVIIPSPEAVELYGIDAIAQKDVPHGKPYAIVSTDEIPTDRTFRAAWTADDGLLTDGVGAEHSTFDEVQP